MKKILLFCPYPEDEAPGQRLKYEQYLPYLREKGYQIEVLPFFPLRAYKSLYSKGKTFSKILFVLKGIAGRIASINKIFKSDGIYVAFNVIPIGPPIIEALYLKLAKKIIYDIDDMIHLNRTSDVNKIASIFKSNTRYFMLMTAANHVITCTPSLDKLARKYNQFTTDISSTINTSVYLPVNNYLNDHRIIIGWTGSHSTSPYLNLLTTIFKKLSKIKNEE